VLSLLACVIPRGTAESKDPHLRVSKLCLGGRGSHSRNVDTSPPGRIRDNRTVPDPTPLDPEDYYLENGLLIFTAAYHLKRGYCCGNACRHCPYNHSNVDRDQRPPDEPETAG
jgi:Family of unknown function (DUF5522)